MNEMQDAAPACRPARYGGQAVTLHLRLEAHWRGASRPLGEQKANMIVWQSGWQRCLWMKDGSELLGSWRR
jgi:hypothetical protein